MIFTKLLRPLVSYWHTLSINICVFLDDGGRTERSLYKAVSSAKFVKKTLELSGFVVNVEKSIWFPQKRMTWLGVIVDFINNSYYITDKRIKTLISLTSCMLQKESLTARELSKLAFHLDEICHGGNNTIKNKSAVRGHRKESGLGRQNQCEKYVKRFRNLHSIV